MSKSREEFMRQRDLPHNKYPATPDQCFEPCQICSGVGFIAESTCCGGSIREGICAICLQPTEASKCITCNGTGVNG